VKFAMPSTLKLIEEMTDVGKFEQLALAVLRRMEPECEAVIHEGLNADGKTINSQVDAEGVVPGSNPPRYVMVVCTTTKRKKLKGKWLFDSRNTGINSTAAAKPRRGRRHLPGPNQEDGDLTKACRRAEEKRKELPDASFKVYLVSNLPGVGELLSSVTAAAMKARIEAEIVEASRLAEFLDIEPPGEFVRFRFFGTPIAHLSSDLLTEMGRTSLSQLKSRPDFDTATKRVARPCARDLQDALTAPSTTLVWVAAPPGKGKSVVSVDAASAYLRDGGFALWLSEQDVNGAESLWQAVDSALRRDHPSLEPEAGRHALSIAQPTQRLVLVVDDLNRLPAPEGAFRKVRNWVRHFSDVKNSTDTGQSTNASCVVVCPIWPQHFEQLERSPSARSQLPPWERVLDVPNFSSSEAGLIFSGTGLSALEIERVANELGSDPFLCAIAAEDIRRHGTAELRGAPEVLRRHLNQQLDRVVKSAGHPASEYLNALQRLAESMLRSKNFRPTWSDVRNWTDDADTRQRLTEMLAAHAVIDIGSPSEVVLFSHDRFLDALCSEAIPAIIDDSAVRSDPYFAEIIGRAIAEGRLSDAVVGHVLDDNPLAVFCALMLAPRDTAQHKLGPLLRRWAQTHRHDDHLPRRLWWEIGLTLLKTDSPVVVDMVSWLPESRVLETAGLLNGSANSGINYCRKGEFRIFLPGVRDRHREAIMEHARSRHGTRLAADLNRDLQQRHLPIEIRRACLLLAGFLGMDELTSGIECCWRNCPPDEQPNIIAAAVWAVARCATARFPDLLHQIFAVWQTMPEGEKDATYHPRSHIAVYQLGHCSPQWMPEPVAAWLAATIESYPGLKLSLEYILSQVDTPSAFTFQVRKLAALNRKRGADAWFSLALLCPWSTSRTHGNRISESSRHRLRTIWLSPEEAVEDRECAFRFWLFSATSSDIPDLRCIKPGEALYELALQRRMELRDRTAATELNADVLQKWWLLSHIPPIWSSGLRASVLEVFRKRHEEFRLYEEQIAALLLSLPEKDAEELLVELWPEWGDEVGFQVTALLIGTPNTKELVAKALDQPQTCDAVLDMAESIMTISWPYMNREEALPIWLDRYAPYLPRASQETLRQLIHLCQSPHTWRWYERYVRPLLEAESCTDFHRRMELPSLEANCRQDRDQYYGAYRFFEFVEQRGLDKKSVLERIADDARRSPSPESLKWLSACIENGGGRADLSLLQGDFPGVPAELLAELRADCAFSVMRRSLT
jgi:hypothetical protein